VGRGGVQTGPTRHVGHFWPIVPAPGDCEDREFGGMKIGRGDRSTRRKPAPTPLCPPQIPLDQTRARTRAAEVGSQRLTAWAMARPCHIRSIVTLFAEYECGLPLLNKHALRLYFLPGYVRSECCTMSDTFIIRKVP
jgi:hypothetical protein